MKDNSILVFLSAPLPDLMDSHFVEAMGRDRAADAYTEIAKSLFGALKKLPSAQVVVAYKNNSKFPDLRWIDQDDPGFLAQRGNTEAERFVSAAGWVFEAGARNIVYVSPYVPAIPPEWIEKAFSALREKDFVVGPTQDGEAYLIGMKTVPAFFDGFPWHGKRMCDEIAEGAKKNRMTVHMLPEFYCVKDEKTYSAWRANTAAPAKEDKPADLPKKEQPRPAQKEKKQ